MSARRAQRRRTRQAVFGDDSRRFWVLVLTLSVTEFRLRYLGSAFGYAWSLMRPLLMFFVIYEVFTHVFRVGNLVHHYPLYLLLGLVVWSYFVEATSGAMVSLVVRRDVLARMRFPRLAIPLSSSVTALFNLGLNLIVILGFLLASGIEPRLSWLELVPLIALVVLLATGLGLLLCTLYVSFRDVEQIWTVATQMIFYATPFLYVASLLRPWGRALLIANPLASVMTQARYAVIDAGAPTAAQSLGGAGWLLVPAAIMIVVCGAGFWAFQRQAPTIAERL